MGKLDSRMERALTATAEEPADSGDALDRADWQGLWQRTRTLEWHTLALVPGDDQTSTAGVATLLARLSRDQGDPIQVADVRALRPKHIDAFLDWARWEASQGARILFVTGPVRTNLATVPITRAADCALLCVSLGVTSAVAARTTIEQIGRERFLGSLLVHATPRLAGREPVRGRAALS